MVLGDTMRLNRLDVRKQSEVIDSMLFSSLCFFLSSITQLYASDFNLCPSFLFTSHFIFWDGVLLLFAASSLLCSNYLFLLLKRELWIELEPSELKVGIFYWDKVLVFQIYWMGGFNSVGGVLGEDQTRSSIVSFCSSHCLWYLLLAAVRLFFLFKLLAYASLYPTNCRASLRANVFFLSKKSIAWWIRGDPYGPCCFFLWYSCNG